MTGLPDTESFYNRASGADWNAELKLQFSKSPRGSVLKRADHRGPLYVQKPFYPEGRDLAHLYLLHPPGGLVSGDKLEIGVCTGEQSRALLTTPGAGRVYRARPDRKLQRQQIELNLEQGSSLEWMPLETILYPDACTRLDTRINLETGAKFIGWEITCLGLPAQNLPFDTGTVEQTLQIWQEGRIRLHERVQIDDNTRSLLSSPVGYRNLPVSALMVAGPFDDCEQEQLNSLIEQVRTACEETDALSGVTLNSGFLMIRYLGEHSDQAMKMFIRCWQQIRPELLGRQACEPRIWAT